MNRIEIVTKLVLTMMTTTFYEEQMKQGVVGLNEAVVKDASYLANLIIEDNDKYERENVTEEDEEQIKTIEEARTKNNNQISFIDEDNP